MSMTNWKAIKQAPRFLYQYVVGFPVVIVTDISVTSLFVGSALIGWQTTPLVGAITFFLGHFLLRLVVNMGEAIVVGSKIQAQASFARNEPPSET